MLPDLLNHQEWADATLWRAVLRSPEARDHPSVRTWLHHIHYVQQAFLQVWRGEPVTVPELRDFPDTRSLLDWGRRGHLAVRSYLDGIGRDDLTRPFAAPWADRYGRTAGCRPGEPTLEQSIVQLAMHSAHHRGQVNACLRQLGAVPPLLDFIVWLWSGRPAADWTNEPGG